MKEIWARLVSWMCGSRFLNRFQLRVEKPASTHRLYLRAAKRTAAKNGVAVW